MKPKQSLFALVGTFALATVSLHGQTFTEIGDAGQTLGTAQDSGLVVSASTVSIFGTIGFPTDADVFSIVVTNPMMFTATTVNGSTLDTALFFFNSLGRAIYTNDDASGVSLQSTLPGGTSFTMSLAPGLYYIAISLSGNEPVNSNGQLLFLPYAGGDPTSVRGAAAGVNPNTLASFNGLTSFGETGAYRIDLRTVPEPSTTALCLAGAGAIAFLLRKRRHGGSA